MVQGKQQLNLKEIHAIGSETIDSLDGRRNFDFMSCADTVKQS